MTGEVPESGGFRHPFAPGVWPDPYPSYRWLAEHDPLYRDPYSGLLLLARYADCDALLRNREASAALAQQARPRATPLPPSMLTTDPPEHDRLRAPAARLLGPQAVAALAGPIGAGIDELLDSLDRPDLPDGRNSVEAVEAIAVPFATTVLAVVLGLAERDRERFTRLARSASVNLDPLARPAAIAAGGQATGELAGLLRQHAGEQAGRRDSALGRFWDGGGLTEAEAVAALMLAVVGGFEPLASLAGTGLHWFSRHPEALVRLTTDPDAAGGAVDELLRIESPVPFVARQATADLSLPSGVLPAGTGALALLGAANRDPQEFTDPEALRVSRAPNPHLAFGAGAHFCLGAPLVRLAGGLLFAQVAERFPGLAPADPAAPRWRPSLVPRALVAVPVRLCPVAR
ncbi:MAG: cytochrome P450 [Mycobacteriales bacterium]